MTIDKKQWTAESVLGSDWAWNFDSSKLVNLVQPSQCAETIPGTCGYCASGCGLLIHMNEGQPVHVRGNPAHTVNQGELCIKGLYEWKALTAPDRATTPLIRRNGRLERATWDEALSLLTQRIQHEIAEKGPEGVGIYTTGQLTLEEHYAIGKMARGILGTPNIDANTRLCMAGAVQGYIRSFGSDGPPGCYADLDLSSLIVVFGCNPAEAHPILWRRIQENVLHRGATLIVVDPRKTLPARLAHTHAALRPGTNVALLNGIMHVIIKEGLIDRAYIDSHTTGFDALADTVSRYTPEYVASVTEVPAEVIRDIALRFGQAKSATTVFVQGVTQSMSAAETVNLICNLHLITGQIGRPGAAPLSLTGQVSSMSNREAGGGGTFVGYRNQMNPAHRAEVADAWGVPEERLPDKVRDITAMLDEIESGKLGLLWNIGTNPAVSLPDLNRVHRLLDKVFYVVQDLYYPVESARFADIFLPAAGWAEKTGTYTNAERRVSLTLRAIAPPGESRSDLEIIQEVARRLDAGHLMPWFDSEQVFEEWKDLSKGRPCDMSGLSHQRLAAEGGIQWPCPSGDHPGTERLYTNGVFSTQAEYAQGYGSQNHPQGRARLWAVDYTAPPEEPCEEYPFWLNTGRILEHYHSRTKTKRVRELNYIAPQGYIEIHPDDAKRLQIDHGEIVRVTSRRGHIEVEAHWTDNVLPGHIFAPFHFGDLDPGEDHLTQAANRLTGSYCCPISRQPMLKIAACQVSKINK